MGKDKGTCIIKVDHCQNGTWQGSIVWADENRTERFRSALELFKLMDSAVNNNEMSTETGEGTA